MKARTRNALRERDEEMARARREALRQRRVYRDTTESREARARVAYHEQEPFNGIRGL